MCELDIFDDFSNRLLSMKFVKARRRHLCHGCGGFIEPGKQYRKYAYTVEGDFQHGKLCRPCALDSDRFAKEHGLAYFYPYGWLEFVENCIDDDGADADPRWKLMKIRADQRRRKAWETKRNEMTPLRVST